jgi:hypothetical protein
MQYSDNVSWSGNMGIIGGSSSSTTSCVSMMTLFRMSVVFAYAINRNFKSLRLWWWNGL